MGRLIQAEHDGKAKSYTYDGFGNRIQSVQNGKETQYAYNSANQLLCMDAPDINKQYEYDPQGDLTKVLANGKLDAEYYKNNVFESVIEKIIGGRYNFWKNKYFRIQLMW